MKEQSWDVERTKKNTNLSLIFFLHLILLVDDASFIEKLIIIIEETTGHTEQLMESLLVKPRASAKLILSKLILKQADILCHRHRALSKI